MSAHSYRDGRRFWNEETYGGYCQAIESSSPASALSGERTASLEEHLAEALFTGLRLVKGVDLAGFRDRYGHDPLELFGARLEEAFAADLLLEDAGRLRLTERGFLLSNEVFQLLV